MLISLLCTRGMKMVELQARGAVTFDYGNNIRQRAFDQGYKGAFSFPGSDPNSSPG